MNVYETLDSFVLGATEKAVKICNNVFGTSRNDLANIMQSIVPGIEFYGHYKASPVVGLVYGSAATALSCISIYINHRQELAEENANNKKCRRNIFYDRYNECEGVIFGVVTLGNIVPTGNPNDANFAIAGAGHLTRAVSHYIMRTSNVPRKKSIFARAFDWTKEKLKSYFPEKVPAEINVE